jgi:hypothetical protein
MWKEEELPEQCKQSGGDNTDCSNYRGVSLLSATFKILSNILLLRLLHKLGKLLGIISVDFDATGQLLIIYSAFIKYLRKNGNTTRQ